VLSNSDTLENQSRPTRSFDLIISNPPYFKLPKTDGRVKAANSVVHGQPNIYSIFLYTAATLLEEDGQLIFITPRSFASGFYFRLFRDKFFALVQLDTVHLFDSRKEAFVRDQVLQENVIISARRSKSDGNRLRIVVSSSHGLKDLHRRQIREFYLDELLDMNSYQKILHLPASDDEAKIVRFFKSWHGSLNVYNIQISTGPVVSFRAKRFIYCHPQVGVSLAPLYWLHNASKMRLAWPLNKTGKGQYIQVCDRSLPLLIPNKNYIFLRRFSSKDDNSRLIATPYFADTVEADLIGVENHLNYIYRPNGHLDRSEILGLAALLNSTLFDTYFRTFNGNINVSATELREMPLPPLETIKQIGNAIILKNNFTQSIVDDVVNHFFQLQREVTTVYE
jgi:adenine-specific DNA-methyltransferase